MVKNITIKIVDTGDSHDFSYFLLFLSSILTTTYGNYNTYILHIDIHLTFSDNVFHFFSLMINVAPQQREMKKTEHTEYTTTQRTC